MSKLYNGGASFGFSLNYNTAVPVDTRFVVSTLADLQNPESWVSGAYDSEIDSNNVYVVYPGLRVTVVEEKAVYVYTENEVNGAKLANIASWTKLSTAEATGNTQAAVDKVEASIGLAEDGSHVTTEGNYTKDATTIAGEIQALDTELKAVNDKIGKTTDEAGTETVYGAIADVQADLLTHHHLGQLRLIGLGGVHGAHALALAEHGASVGNGHDLIELVGNEQD